MAAVVLVQCVIARYGCGVVLLQVDSIDVGCCCPSTWFQSESLLRSIVQHIVDIDDSVNCNITAYLSYHFRRLAISRISRCWSRCCSL